MKRVKRFFKFFGIGVAILVGVILVTGQIAYHSTPLIEPPGKLYSIDGKMMHLYCTGPENDSMPTIIIITGAGTQSPLYYNLQEKLSKTIRTCSYDRAGNGWSEPTSIPANAKNMSNELHGLLQVAKIDGPIVLAGHSLGGIVSLIYSAEHPEQVAGIAFIDSSHYNQVEYFGKEYSDAWHNQTEDILGIFWVTELVSKLGIVNILIAIQNTSEFGLDEEEKTMMMYFDRWAPQYDAIKSEIENLRLSFEQGKEAHYDRGALPIISISASDHDTSAFPKVGPSEQEIADSFIDRHQELASLSEIGQHVVIDGTNHMSIVYNKETATQILNFVLGIDKQYPIDSKCDWFLANQLEYQLPEPSQWYLDNFSEEYVTLRNSINDKKWNDENYQSSALDSYHESLSKKTIPELRSFEWELLESGEGYFDEIMNQDPQCHQIIKNNYPGFDSFR